VIACISIKTRYVKIFVSLLISCIPFVVSAQDSLLARSFRTKNPHDRHTLVMENESRALPGEKEKTYAITITVTNIRNTDGVIRFKFYDEQAPFPHDKGFLRIVVPKSQVVNNTFTATYYGFTAKKMGIALHDDENNDMELQMGWLFPKEGHAFSDYYHAVLRRPVYSDFEFTLMGDTHVVMKMRYY
jgi:uncharacterized protein (DUF2141 family)